MAKKKIVCTSAHTYTERERDMHMNGMQGICPRAWLCLSKARLSQRPVEAQYYTLSIRIHQWHRNGGTQAFILRKPTFSLYLPLFTPSLVHPSPPPPLLALFYYLPLLLFPPPPPPHLLLRLKTPLPPSSPEGSLFNRDQNSEPHGP